jgi:DNA-binding NarL/FixJ family response regulator
MKAQQNINRKKSTAILPVIVLFSENEKFADHLESIGNVGFQFEYIILEHKSSRIPKQLWKLSGEKIILADLTEGSGNSPYTIAELKSAMPFFPMIVLSDKKDLENVRHCFLQGADGYILEEDFTQKFGKILQDFLKTRVSPVSKAIVPQLVTLAQGKKLSGAKFMELSKVQRNVARLLVNGMSYQEAADMLEINLNNLRYHIKQVYKKLDITRKMELVSMIAPE